MLLSARIAIRRPTFLLVRENGLKRLRDDLHYLRGSPGAPVLSYFGRGMWYVLVCLCCTVIVLSACFSSSWARKRSFLCLAACAPEISSSTDRMTLEGE